MSQPRRRWSEHQVEQFVGNLLRFGVLCATTVVLVGGILYLIRYGNSPANYQFFRGEPTDFSSNTEYIPFQETVFNSMYPYRHPNYPYL